MKNKYTYLVVIAALFVAVAASIASAVITMMKMPPKGSITIVYDGKENIFDPAKAATVDVSGTILNAKGDKKDVSAKGFLLKDAITTAGIKDADFISATVTSSDSFTANLTFNEIAETGKVYLTEDTSDKGEKFLRLVVFGDNDSTRQIKNVVRIDLVK